MASKRDGLALRLHRNHLWVLLRDFPAWARQKGVRVQERVLALGQECVRTLVPKLVLALEQERVLGPLQQWAGPTPALGHPVWVPPQAHFPASAPQRTLTAQKRVLLPQELVPQVRDPLPQVHPVPALGREWVLVLSTERELGLASAEGLGLAWE